MDIHCIASPHWHVSSMPAQPIVAFRALTPQAGMALWRCARQLSQSLLCPAPSRKGQGGVMTGDYQFAINLFVDKAVLDFDGAVGISCTGKVVMSHGM